MIELQIQQFQQFLEIFNEYLDNPRYQRILYEMALSMPYHESNKILPYLLSYLCYDTAINQHPNFDKCFLYVLNLLMQQLIAKNKNEYAFSFLMSGQNHQMIYFKLLELKCYVAAEQVLNLMRYLSEHNIRAIFDIQWAFHTVSQQFSHLQSLSRPELMQLTNLMIKSKQYFGLQESLIKNWFLSLEGHQLEDISQVFTMPGMDAAIRKRYLDVLIMLIDEQVISVSSWKAMFRAKSPHTTTTLDQVILNFSLEREAFMIILEFFEKLYLHGHMSYGEYKNLVLKHPRPGFSPLHAILMIGNSDALVTYLDFIDSQYLQGQIKLEDIQDAFLSLNFRGFNTLYQAVNNFSKEITLAYLPYFCQFFNQEKIYALLTKDTYNPVMGKFIKLTCCADKRHQKQINTLLAEMKRALFKELEELKFRASSSGFFSPIRFELPHRYSPIQFELPVQTSSNLGGGKSM